MEDWLASGEILFIQTQRGHWPTTYNSPERLQDNVKDALHEVKLSLTLTSGVTLFDSSGVTTHEFSDNVVEAIAENCSKKFFAC